MRQQLAGIQRELSVLQRGVNDSTGYNPVVVTSELDDDDQQEADNLVNLKKMEVMQSGTEERKMSIKGWRRLKRIPQGSVENGIIRR